MPSSGDALQRKIGQRLRDLRTQAGLTQGEVADYLTKFTNDSYQQSTIGKMERGVRSLSFVESVYLAKIFNIEQSKLASVVRDGANLSVRLEETRTHYKSIANELRDDLIPRASSGLRDFFDLLRENKNSPLKDPDELTQILEEWPVITENMSKLQTALRRAEDYAGEVASELDPEVWADRYLDQMGPYA